MIITELNYLESTTTDVVGSRKKSAGRIDVNIDIVKFSIKQDADVDIYAKKIYADDDNFNASNYVSFKIYQ